MTLELVKAWIQSTDAYQAFDKARRDSVRAALLAAVQDARAQSVAIVADGALTDKHLDAVASAGLPVMKILKLIGASTLTKIAASLGAEEKKA